LKKGYHAALDILEKFEEEDKLPSAFINGKDGNHTEKKKGKSARRNSI
jgi:lysophospholipid hydrolase